MRPDLYATMAIIPTMWNPRPWPLCQCADDSRQSREYRDVFIRHGSWSAGCVTPPVIPPYFYHRSDEITAGPIGHGVEPWINEAEPFRSATAGRSFHTRLVDAEIMSGYDE